MKPNGLVALLSICIGLSWSARGRARAVQRLQMGLSQSNYLSPPFVAQKSSSYSDLLLRFNYEADHARSKIKADIAGVYSLNGVSDNHVYVPDLSYSKPLTANLRLTLGRHRLSWSRLDQLWQLGLWQPLFNWDLLHPVEQGLTGAFLKYQGNGFYLTAFGSPLYLPNQDPQVSVHDGQVTSPSRWFDPLVQRVQIQAAQDNVVYDIDRPSLNEVVQRSSYGFLLHVQAQRRQGPWVQAAFANKPMNNIVYETKITQSLEDGTPIHVMIYPHIFRHSLATAEFGWNWSGVKTWVSFSEDKPQKVVLPADWDVTPLPIQQIWGLGLENELNLHQLGLWQMKWLYLGSTSGTDQAQRKDQRASLTRKVESLAQGDLRFSQALRWQGQTQLESRYNLGLQVAYTYAPDVRGGLLSGQVNWAPNWRWQVYLGMDIIGHEGRDTSSFFARYQANDRVRGGFTYVF